MSQCSRFLSLGEVVAIDLELLFHMKSTSFRMSNKTIFSAETNIRRNIRTEYLLSIGSVVDLPAVITGDSFHSLDEEQTVSTSSMSDTGLSLIEIDSFFREGPMELKHNHAS